LVISIVRCPAGGWQRTWDLLCRIRHRPREFASAKNQRNSFIGLYVIVQARPLTLVSKLVSISGRIISHPQPAVVEVSWMRSESP
jgi:hypothetical protein